MYSVFVYVQYVHFGMWIEWEILRVTGHVYNLAGNRTYGKRSSRGMTQLSCSASKSIFGEVLMTTAFLDGLAEYRWGPVLPNPSSRPMTHAISFSFHPMIEKPSHRILRDISSLHTVRAHVNYIKEGGEPVRS